MSETRKIKLPNLFATHFLGICFGKFLDSGRVILLSGNLGTGKTSFVKGIGEGLGISESIVSPTFNLINEYLDGRVPLYHLDLYRLGSNEISHLSLETYWESIEVEPGIMAIEWAEKMPYKPNSYISINLVYTDGNMREADIYLCNCDLGDICSQIFCSFEHRIHKD